MQPIWQVPRADRLRNRYGVLEGKCLLCCRVVPMSAWWILCVFTQRGSRWVPTCSSHCVSLSPSSLSAAVTLPLLLPSSFCSSFFFFFTPVRCSSSSLLLYPLPLALSFALHCSSSLALSLCFLSEWCRRSELRPHSSLWQPQPPDKRKQIPQQEPDINGLSCFSCHSLFFFFLG